MVRLPDLFINRQPIMPVAGDVVCTRDKKECGCYYEYMQAYKGFMGMPSATMGEKVLVEFSLCEGCKVKLNKRHSLVCELKGVRSYDAS